MHAWESIQKAVDYIEDNISKSMTPEELASVAALSPFYFQRLFTRLIKRPVNDYIKMRRLARACGVLENKSSRILDIALEYGFNSHESFTKAFKSAFGITPEEFRTAPVHLNQVMKPELLLNYTTVDENVPIITDSIVLEITRKQVTLPERYIGVSGKVSMAQATFGEAAGISAPGQLWEMFHRQKADIPGLLPDGIELGASMMNEAADETFTYFAGASAVLEASAPEGCTSWTLPAAEYVVCSFEAENFAALTTSALDKAMKYLFGTWLPSHRLITQPFSAEKYYNTDADATSMEVWVIPVPMEDTIK